MLLFEKILKNMELEGDKPILADDTKPRGITTNQLWEISGKVYSYLKANGIGREDFVQICLPRGMQPLVAELGVWRAGAAFVLVEDNYAPERIKFIRENSQCKLVIDSEAWEKIQKLPAAEGWEEAGEHDAAFAVYTSGTTGNPKGVLHEYGNIDRMIRSTILDNGELLIGRNQKFALVAPLNFIASLLITVYGFYHNIFFYVVSYSTTKNPAQLGLFILKNQIVGTFLTPSYLRKMKKKPPMIQMCIIGSEPANGVYFDGLAIHNFYLMSESGFAVLHKQLDRKYDEAPVGNNLFELEVQLLDENGNQVADGSEGEIVFENKYVRGYIGLPEETAKAFRDGLYHTGDLGKMNEKGEVIICGRLNDMVKINGNRVEPGEIENVIKKVLQVKEAAVRIFNDGNRVFIVGYYTDPVQLDYEDALKKMARYLPYYMLPSFLIHLDKLPMTATGKLNRKELPAPDFSSYQDDYVAPGNPVEAELCEAFAKVLQMQRVGINDDFYQMGGDSLAAIEVLELCKLPGLSAGVIFKGRTPAKIAEIYNASGAANELALSEEEELAARSRTYKLSAFQMYMFDYQLYTPMSTMLNLFSMLKLDKEQYDMEKVALALEKVIAHHPALATRLRWNEDGEVVQEYYPEYNKKIPVERISEMDLRFDRKSFVRPFKLIDSCLYRVKVIETEKAGYIFFDVHHVLFDGTCFSIMMRDLMKAYYGLDLSPDYYFLTTANRTRIMESERYAEDRAYFEKRYGATDGYSTKPDPDINVLEETSVSHQAVKNILAHYSTDISDMDKALTEVENKYRIGRNAFFSLVTMLAIAIHNQKDSVMISWTYNGRDELYKMDMFGLLLCDLPLAVTLTKDRKLEDLYKDVAEQLAADIEHCSYPYTLEKAGNIIDDDQVCFLYQQNIRDGGANMEDMNIEQVTVEDTEAASENILDVQILDDSNGLKLVMDYNAGVYKKENIERYGRIFAATAKAMLDVVDSDGVPFRQIVREVQKQVHEWSLFLSWLK